MTFDNIILLIRNWLINSSGLNPSNVSQMFQNAPKPEQDFISFNPNVSYREIGYFEKNFNQDGLVEKKQSYEVLMQIDCFGINSFLIMQKVLSSLNSESVTQNFKDNNISVCSDGEIKNLSFIEGTQQNNTRLWQKRYSLDISVYYQEITLEDVGYFDTIEIEFESERNENLDTTNSILNASIEKTIPELYNNDIVKTSILKDLPELENNNSLISLDLVKNENQYETTNKPLEINAIINNIYKQSIISDLPIVLNLRIFEYLLENLNDNSGNNINLIAINKNGSEDVLFDFQFDEINGLNDNSDNNNDLVSFNPINTNYTLFNYNFQTLNDNSGNNNNLVTI